MRTTGIIVAAAIGLLVLRIAVTPHYPDDAISPVLTGAMSEAKQVGMAARLYADDHQGHLPENLQQLTPNYLPDGKFFPRMQLTTPGVLLKDLPPNSIIAVKTATDPKQKRARVVFVRADLSVNLGHP